MDSLEQEMQRVKDTFASKVKHLTEEKHKAEEQAQYHPSILISLALFDEQSFQVSCVEASIL